MRAVKHIRDFIKHVCDFFHDGKNAIIKTNHCIVLRPDGTWQLTEIKKLGKPFVKPPPVPAYPSIRSSWNDPNDSIEPGDLLEAPEFFPHKDELKNKLEQCIDIDVITNYQHSLTSHGTYMLRIELPCSAEDYAQSYNQFKLFVRAMEQKYNFKTLQQDRVTSKTSQNKIHIVVFEYDPRKKLF